METSITNIEKCVITGDMVNSTAIEARWKSLVFDALSACIDDFSSQTLCRLELYRGDSFQVVVEDITFAVSVAVALRAKLKSVTPTVGPTWDARLSVGIGDIDFESKSIVTSDGEAFRLSGRTFDLLGRRRLSVTTPWENFDTAYSLNTKFADEIISSWTAKQALLVYHEILTSYSQKELSVHLGMTPQNLNKIWNSSKCSLIVEYINRYKELLKEHRNS